ncbi:MAG TPA: sigma-70 family RNA polymerase sigma factor [Steroidobacteraceae bacterium]|nr:sigma-70 family RNA polymerase sigma factor [Steroidobacteraceae bacterium]
MADPEARLRELMLRGLAGDAQAQRDLLAELATLLQRFHRRRLGAVSDVDDLVQETLIAMHERRDTYDPARPFTAWVYSITRYKLIDHFRRRRARLAVSLDDCTDLFSDSAIDQAADARDVELLLTELPERQRDAIRLTRIEGWSVAEAAARTGQTIASIKVNVHRGLKRLMSLRRRD